MEVLSAPLAYAAKGKPVFPCGIDKRPLVEHGFKAASTDRVMVTDWWTKWPDALIGSPTGDGFFVLDVDVPGGDESLTQLEAIHGALPATLEQRTGSGGRHLFFKTPCTIKNSAGKLGHKLDIRGSGGYIILPPSRHESGGRYEWANRLPMAEAPDWLVDMLIEHQTRLAPVPLEAKGRPGDDFNSRGDIRPLLEKHGWQPAGHSGGRECWTRPGKGSGVSATLFDDGSLFVFTGNAPPFDSEERYSPFAVYALLEHGGDYQAAAKILAAQGFGKQRQVVAPTHKTDEEAEKWPEPSPLTTHHQATPYPLDALPGTIGAAVREVVGFVQCPVALGACSALAVVSTVAQGLVDVRRACKLEGPTSLYFLAIADSGERKTTVDGFFSKPVQQWEAEQAEAAKPDLKRYEAKRDTWEAKKTGLLAAIKTASQSGKSTVEFEKKVADLEAERPEPPRIPRLLHEDTTPEALAFLLAKGWPLGGVLSSEAGTVFGGHAMGKDSAMRNMGLLNKLWEGGRVTVDRRSVESFIVQGARLSMGLAVQPEAVRSFLDASKGLARGIGFLARFLIAWPESTQGGRMFSDSPEHWPHLAKFHRRLGALLDSPLPVNDRGELEPVMLELSPEAKTLWVAFHNDVEAELRPGRDMAETKDVASKAADNAARLAALFHLFENDPGGTIGPEHMKAAACLAGWHLYEARRFMGEIALPVAVNNAAKLEAWLLERCRQKQVMEVSTREIQQEGPNCTRDKLPLDAALAELDEAGRFRVMKEGRRRLVKINPALLGGGHGVA